MTAPAVDWPPNPPSGPSDDATATPRKPVPPMCTVADELPASIWLAIDSAVLIGIEKAVVGTEVVLEASWGPVWAAVEAAVSMPITGPAVSASGPPDAPGWMSALV